MEICSWWGGNGNTLRMCQRLVDRRGSQESMGVSLAVTHSIRNMEPREAASCVQAAILWSYRDTNTLIKHLTKTYSVYKECSDWGWSRD